VSELRETALASLREVLQSASVGSESTQIAAVAAAEMLAEIGALDADLIPSVCRLAHGPNCGAARVRAAALLLQLVKEENP
jgi:hypothetical protein